MDKLRLQYKKCMDLYEAQEYEIALLSSRKKEGYSLNCVRKE